MPLSRREELNQYYQDLLVAQYNASKNISHEPSKGTARENFVKDLIKKTKGAELKLYHGVFECGDTWQSNEADFIWQRRGEESEFGTYNLHDCKMMMEIKSCAKTEEIKKLNEQASVLKSNHDNRRYFKAGMFCYGTQIKRSKILERFGHPYDREIMSFSQYDASKDEYRNIDFLFSLDLKNDVKPEPYFIYREIGNTRLYIVQPVIYYFLLMFDDLR